MTYHNCLNLNVLEKLAFVCDIMYLHELLQEYQETFFTTKLFDLFPSREFRQINVKSADDVFVIESHESNNILKKDVTIKDLDDFIIEYSNLIQNSQAVKKVCGPQKGYGEKRCEIQGGGQEMAVMVG